MLIYLRAAASFVAILTSAGLAIGLALQGSLSNFAGGLMILFFKPFKVGDFIKTETADGTVQDISIMYTNAAHAGRQEGSAQRQLSNDVITDFSGTIPGALISASRRILRGRGEDQRPADGRGARNESVLKDRPPGRPWTNPGRHPAAYPACWAKDFEWWATNIAPLRRKGRTEAQARPAGRAGVRQFKKALRDG